MSNPDPKNGQRWRFKTFSLILILELEDASKYAENSRAQLDWRILFSSGDLAKTSYYQIGKENHFYIDHCFTYLHGQDKINEQA